MSICKKYQILLICCIISSWSCASSGNFSAIDNEVERTRYTESVELLDRRRNSLYQTRDDILYYLDKGMLNYYAQNYTESSELLQMAERAIEDAYTQSITQGIGTLLLNDNAREYGGEDYEDIYINVFNALNFYHRGESEGAMVEIRRLSNKLQHLSAKYDVVISNLQRHALEENLSVIPPNPQSPVQFSDSALARYLGMLFYRSAGLSDDARISRNWLLAAFANNPSVYRHPVPASISGELEIPDGMARLNVLAFGGLSPVKTEHVTRIFLPGGHWVKIALPEMVSRRSHIHRVALVLDSGQTFDLELLEDIDAVAKATFSLRQQTIYLRTIIRTMLKSAGSIALHAASEEISNETTSLLLRLLSLTSQIFAEASEHADVRVSRYFPARAYVTGINLPPGSYNIRVNFYNRNGREIASVLHQDVIVRENALNLVEAVCLR